MSCKLRHLSKITALSRHYSADPPVTVKPSDFQRKVLVWIKRYPSLADVPDRVEPSVLTRAQDKFRTKVATRLMILTALTSAITIFYAKREVAGGDSTLKRNLERHEQLRPGSTKSTF